jgi:protein-S-isoprenylcysteine O-methyltransferase Ste14
MTRLQMNMNPVRLLLNVPVPWVFVLCYFLGAALEILAPFEFRRQLPASVSLAGAVVFAIGAIIAAWPLLIFFKARTTTVPGKTSSTLVTRGPYRFTRNPMYVGLTIAYLGEAAILKHVWPVILLPPTLAYLNWIVIPLEEARLTEVFQDEYDRYCARVRRWI